MHEYDLIADWYSTDHNLVTAIPEVTSLIASLPAGASVLDVGCGNGIPVTRTLLAAGCHVLGVDSSAKMLAKFQVNCPGTPSVCSTIEACDLHGRMFDAAVAWGVIFHLTHAVQAMAIAKVSEALKPGGLFLFTSGDENGSVEGGVMNGVTFPYYSFTVDGYRDLLRTHGLTLIETHYDAGHNLYYLARRES